MNKLDFVAQEKQFYQPAKEPAIVEVPDMLFLMFDGQGMPESNPLFQKAFQALYGIAYTIKFLPKKGQIPKGYVDFKVPPPEGLWWMKGDKIFDTAKPEDWRWTLMLRMPDFVDQTLLTEVVEQLVAKKKDDIYRQVRLEPYEEGESVQMLYVGAYENEAPALKLMQEFAKAQGFKAAGKHHEIYFGDPRRSKPENLKTVLRQPIMQA